MHQKVIAKLEKLTARSQELNQQLSDPTVTSDLQRFRELSKEYSQLEPIVNLYQEHVSTKTNLDETELLLENADPELKQLATQEIKDLQQKLEKITNELQVLLLPVDPNDAKNIFLEIRAGTGGDEAAIFAGDLMRMYSKYAEKQGWRIEILGTSETERGGYKEVIARIVGKSAYSYLKFESGAHRVQRVPLTEAQGRVHTSTCTVAVFPEIEEVDKIDINPTDLRIDTYRAQGAGGQHVNKTDSAVRITHLPTGAVVACQSERSQIQNRARAMALLQSKILDEIQDKQHQEQAATRKSLVGTGKRAERIRTYNFPQGRITDHRINLTLYNLPNILNGDLQQVIEPLMQEYHTEQLSLMQS